LIAKHKNTVFAVSSWLFHFSEAATLTNPKVVWARCPIKCIL